MAEIKIEKQEIENKKEKPELIIPPEIKARILAERKIWYNFIPAKLEMIKCLHNKEMAIFSPKGIKKQIPVRYLVAFYHEWFDKHLERFEFFKNLQNMYCSVANLKDIPIFEYSLKLRRHTPEYKKWNEKYADYVVSYDFFLDIDSDGTEEDFLKAHKEATEIKKILDEHMLPYFVLTSSKKGIHFCIDGKYLPKMEINKLLETINEIVYNLKGTFEFSYLDDSVIDMKRVRALPYSYKCLDNSICLPLNDSQFQFLKQSDVDMKNVMSKIFIKNRGLLTRNLNLSEDTLKKNVLRFFKDFE